MLLGNCQFGGREVPWRWALGRESSAERGAAQIHTEANCHPLSSVFKVSTQRPESKLA